MATSYSNYQNDNRAPSPNNNGDCEERDNATQKKINLVKKKYCDDLQTSDSRIKGLFHVYESNEHSYRKKELRFLFTQDNYQRYVNTEISFGSQLKQANERIKAGISSYADWDKNLGDSLKSLFTAIKDLKTKTDLLRDAATKIDNSRNESCDTAQWSLITGKNADNCKDDNKPPTPTTEGCKDAENNLNHLVCMPKALAKDADYFFKSASDIIGIQKFCNLAGLKTLQDVLYTKTTDFDGLLQTAITKRKTELDTRQKDLTDALKDRTNAVMDLYSERCVYAGLHKTLEEICCPRCGCVKTNAGNCEPRLEDCQCQICDICGEVKNTFLLQNDTPKAQE